MVNEQIVNGVMKGTLQLITAAVMSIGGLILLFCGVFIDPQGEIDSSLLIGFGEVATFLPSASVAFFIFLDLSYKKMHPALANVIFFSYLCGINDITI